MSRIGNAQIKVPIGVTIERSGKNLMVNGPKGRLTMEVVPEIKVEIDGDQILLKRKNDQKRAKALHGLVRSLIANMVLGVTEGWSKNLELVGVGFRAQSSGDKLLLNVGYSHPVE
ncbi:MAG: large subunit ribosomal protein L6, partial [bacterium]